MLGAGATTYIWDMGYLHHIYADVRRISTSLRNYLKRRSRRRTMRKNISRPYNANRLPRQLRLPDEILNKPLPRPPSIHYKFKSLTHSPCHSSSQSTDLEKASYKKHISRKERASYKTHLSGKEKAYYRAHHHSSWEDKAHHYTSHPSPTEKAYYKEKASPKYKSSLTSKDRSSAGTGITETSLTPSTSLSSRCLNATSHNLPQTKDEAEGKPDTAKYIPAISWQLGSFILLVFGLTFILFTTLHIVLKNTRREFELFSSLYLAGTIIFGGESCFLSFLGGREGRRRNRRPFPLSLLLP